MIEQVRYCRATRRLDLTECAVAHFRKQYNDFVVHISLYHWLTKHLTFATSHDRWYRQQNHNNGLNWNTAQRYVQSRGTSVLDMIESNKVPTMTDIRFRILRWNEWRTDLLFLQMYIGDDTWTNPKIFYPKPSFKMRDAKKASLIARDTNDQRQKVIWDVIPENAHRWVTTDSGDTWAFDSDNYDDIKPLQSFEMSEDENHRGDGEHIYVDDKGNGYSPLTGIMLRPEF